MKKPKLIDQSYELVAIEQVRPHPRNVNEGNIGAIAASMQANGFYGALRVQRSSGFIVAGNHSWRAAKEIGLRQVPVIYLDISDDQALRIMLADNQTARESHNREQELADLLSEIQLTSDGLVGTGFDDDALAKLLEGLGDSVLAGGEKEAAGGQEIEEEEEPQIDRAEELLEKWKVVAGQIWNIGAHRLMCGDSTDAAAVARLMHGERAGLMNTDPPYGIKYDSADLHEHGVSFTRIQNDERQNEDIQAFLENVFRVALTALSSNAAWYLWHAMLTQGFFAAAAAAAAHVILHRQIIWVKPVLVFGRGQYHWKHELCFMGWVKGFEPPDYGAGNGERNQVTVWEMAGVKHADRKEFSHSTPKPVGLFTVPIVKHLRRGEIAYEPFAWSGPQFVAAEQAGVRCYGIEIEPKFCAVILERMEKLGLKPELSAQ